MTPLSHSKAAALKHRELREVILAVRRQHDAELVASILAARCK